MHFPTASVESSLARAPTCVGGAGEGRRLVIPRVGGMEKYTRGTADAVAQAMMIGKKSLVEFTIRTQLTTHAMLASQMKNPANTWEAVGPGAAAAVPGVSDAPEKKSNPGLSEEAASKIGPMLAREGAMALPLYTPSDHVITVANQALAKAISEIGGGLEKGGQVPVSTVADDQIQLTWGRTSKATGESAPLCVYAKTNMCVAADIATPALGPLHGQLTATEEERFQLHGAAAVPHDRMCLLCARHHLGALIEAHAGSGSAHRRCDHAIVVPLTASLVNAPGGYAAGACHPIGPVVAANIVRADLPMVARHNPETGKWFVDQGAAVFGVKPSPLN